jgi:hypothetical protein
LCLGHAEVKKNAMEFFLPTALLYVCESWEGVSLPMLNNLKGAYGQTLFVCHHQFLLETFTSIDYNQLSKN